jgi:phosphoribosylamine--glycine ligase
VAARIVKFNGPLQVTAVKRGGKWHVIEYNIRIGVTSGPMILRMLKNPAEMVLRTARNKKLDVQFNDKLELGCSLTLAGYGYPFTQVRGPHCRWKWTANSIATCGGTKWRAASDGKLVSTGHRIADVIALAPEAGRGDCEGLREHPQNPRCRQLFPHGHRPKFVAAGKCVIR